MELTFSQERQKIYHICVDRLSGMLEGVRNYGEKNRGLGYQWGGRDDLLNRAASFRDEF